MADGKFRLWRYAAIVLALALGAFVLWRVILGWAPSRDDYPVQGIVVDANHGKLDWPMLAATGVDLVTAISLTSWRPTVRRTVTRALPPIWPVRAKQVFVSARCTAMIYAVWRAIRRRYSSPRFHAPIRHCPPP